MAKRITKHFLILTFLFLALGASKAIAGPTYTITSVIDECNNLSNGSFDIVVSAASGPNLRIIVFGPGSFADIDTGNFPMPALPFTFNVTGAPNGSYTVIVRDGSGPTIKLQDIVNYPSLSISGQIVTDNTVCGNSAGAIDITVAGGSGVISNYRYLWSNGATTQDVSGLASGSYSVTITDIQSACTLNPSFFVNDPQPLNFSIATSTPSICNGGNINISVGTPLASNPAENGVAYQLRVNGSNVLGSQVGDGVSPITFSLPTSSYISGQTIDVSATLPPCLPKLSGNTLSVVVNPTPVLVAGQSKTICSGDNAAYEILLAPLNLPLGTTFSWPDPDGAGPATAGTNVAMGVAGTTHINDVLTIGTTTTTITYVVTPTTGSCPGIPQNVSITVNPTPVLVAGQSKTICPGDNTAYEILLTPLNLPLGTTFSWPDPDGAGPATAGTNVAMGVAGTTHINDVLTNATTAAITITYVVTPTTGSCPGTPQNVVITVSPTPVLVAGQSKTICSGDNTAYEILLTPLNLPLGTTFSWPDPDGAGPATAGTNVAMGVAGTTHINDVLTTGTTSSTVTYVVTPSVGTCAGLPQNITITINPKPVLVVGQSKTICSGDNTAYEILLTPLNLPLGTTFSWPDPDGAGPATAGTNVAMGVAGTTHINDVLTNTTTAVITITYVVTPTTGSCPGIPQNVSITVSPTPVLVVGQSNTICSGDNTAYEILLAPLNLPLGTTFNWPDPDGAGPATAGTNVAMGVAGTTHINDVLTTGTTSSTVIYVVTPSVGTCAGLPQNVTITVNPKPVLVAGQSKTICSGDNAAYEILLAPLNLPLGTTFSWPDPDGAGPATAGTNVAMGVVGTTHINDVLTTGTTSSTVTYVVTPSVGTCAGLPQNVSITVNPTPVLVAGQSKTICPGDNTAYEILLTPLNLPLGTTFSWPDPDGAGPATAGTNVAMGVAGTTHINDVLTNATTAAITITYVVTPTTGSCPGIPQNVSITVSPTPVLVVGQSNTICSGDNTAYEILLTPLNLPLGTTFNWPDPDGAGPATAGTNVAMGVAGTTHINDVLTTGTASSTVTYVVTPSVGTCAGLPQNVTITINPKPVLVVGQSKAICSGDNTAFEILLTPLNLPLGTTFSWPDPDGAGPATAGTNVAMGVAGTTHINDVLTNATTAVITITYVVTPTTGSCPGIPQNVSITVSPTPVLVVGQSNTICSGDNTAYEILLAPLNLPLGTTFNWPDPDGAGPATAGTNVAMGVAGTTHINDVLTTGTASSTVTYVVTPFVGTCPSVPQNVTITVNPKPVLVVGQSKTICSGDNTAYEILLSPLNLPLGTTFDWPDPDGAGPATAGTNVAMGVAGTTHINDVLTSTVTYVVTPSAGTCVGVPQNVVITVSSPPVLVAGQSKTICSGNNTAYEILLTPLNLPLGTTFDWPDPDGAGPATAGTNVAMGVAGTTHINDVLTSTVTYVVTPSVGTCAGVPQNVVITVSSPPVLVAGQSKTICSGDNTAYEILLTPLNLPLGTTFDWPDPDGGGPATAGTNVAMGIAGTTHINDVLTSTVTYFVTPSIGTCAGVPQNVVITVSPAPVLVVGQSKTICSGDNTAYEILLTPLNLPLGTTFDWPDPDGVGPATAGTNVAMGVAGTTHINDVLTSTVTYVVTPSIGTCAGVPQNVIITVSPAPVLVVGQSKTICSGDNTAYEILLTPLNFPLGTTFDWPDPDGAGPATAGTNVAMGVAGTTHINDVLTNVTAAPIIVTYVITPSVGTCVGIPQSIAITVNPSPASSPTVTFTPTNYCVGQPITAPFVTTPVVGSTYTWYSDIALTTVLTTGTNPSNASLGFSSAIPTTPDITVYVTETNSSSCPSPVKAVTLIVSSPPAAPLITFNPKNYCVGATIIFPFVASPVVGSTYNWYDASSTLLFTGTNPVAGDLGASFSTSAPIITSVFVAETNSLGCQGAVSPPVTLTVNAVTPSTGPGIDTWVGDVYDDASNLIPDFAPSKYRGFIVEAEINTITPGYNSVTDVFDLNLGNTPATALTGTNICGSYGDHYSIRFRMTKTLAAGAYTFKLSADDGVRLYIDDPTPTNPSGPPINLSPGGSFADHSYKLFTSDQLCLTAGPHNFVLDYYENTGFSQITFDYDFVPNPTPSVAINLSTPSSTICTGTSITFTAVPTNGGTLPTYQWSVNGTPILGATGVTFTPAVLADADVVTVDMVSNLSCATTFNALPTSVAITVITIAAPTVSSPVNYCQLATASSLTATPTGTNTLLWYTVAVGGVGSAVAPTPSTAAIGTTSYFVSQTDGTCEGPRSQIDVVISTPPSAPGVTTPINYCQLDIPSPLTATPTGTNTLVWYTVATGGVGSTTAPTPSTASLGTTSYFVSQDNGICEGTRAQIDVVVGIPSAPTVTTPLTYCKGDVAVALTATPTGTNTLLWYTVATGGIGNATAPVPSTASVGTTNYFVSQTTGTCEGSRAQIDVVVSNPPIAPIVSTPVNYCQGATASALTATTGSGGVLQWYTVASGGTASLIAPTPSTVSTGTTSYFVSEKVGTCEGPRAQIDVIVTPLDVAPTVTPTVNYCQGDIAIALTATGTNLKWYTVAVGGIGSAIAPTPSTASTGTTSYFVSQTSVGTCESPRAKIDVVVQASPLANLGVTAAVPSVCPNGSTTINIQSSQVGVNYQLRNGTTNILTPIGGNGGILPLPTGPLATTTTFNIVATNANGSCAPVPLTNNTTSVTVKLATDPSCGGGGVCPVISVRPVSSPAKCARFDGSVDMNIVATPAPSSFTEVLNVTINRIFPAAPIVTYSFSNQGSFIFPNLPAGSYTWQVAYTNTANTTCNQTQNGTFIVDQSGTVGTPTVTVLSAPICSGSATGSIQIEVPNQAGNPFEWSITPSVASSWKPFTSDQPFVGIPSGLAPSFTQVVSVRKDALDACYASVSFTLQDQFTPLTASITLQQAATCNTNDGSVLASFSGGDNTAYKFELDGSAFVMPASKIISNLKGGNHTLRVYDNQNCFIDLTGAQFFVPSPGLVGFTLTKTDPTCVGNGNDGKVQLTVDPSFLPGNYQAAISQQQGGTPTFVTVSPAGTFEFTGLSTAKYFLTVKPVANSCPNELSIQVGDLISGFSQVSFSHTIVCEGGEAVLKITSIKAATGNFTIEITKKGSVAPDKSKSFSSIPAGATYTMRGNELPSSKGDYTIKLKQTQGSCEISSPNDASYEFTYNGILAIETKKVSPSYPDQPTGAIDLVNFTGGTKPYSVTIRFDSASNPLVIPTDFKPTTQEVTELNNALQFVKKYSRLNAGRYHLTVNEEEGCSLEFDVRVPLDYVFDPNSIPNVFTPNGDNSNDTFYIRNLPPDAQISIASRSGVEVYSSSNYQNDWNGGNAPDGIYYFRMSVTGNTFTGWVEIIRGK